MDVVEDVEPSGNEGTSSAPVAAPEKVPSGVVKINGATVEEFTQVRLLTI